MALKPPHQDDIAIDMFAAAMKKRMKAMRVKGKSGWEDPEKRSIKELRNAMTECFIRKSDMIDIGNYAMMIFNRLG